MYSYSVDWKRTVLTARLLGLCGVLLMAAGLLWHWLPAVIAGSFVLWCAIYIYIHRSWEQGDFISLADSYLLVCRRKKEYIFHASDIKEIVYGNYIGLKFQKQWFNLSCFVQCKQFQNDIVQFAVRNGIFVHASGCAGQGQGKYSRLRLIKR